MSGLSRILEQLIARSGSLLQDIVEVNCQFPRSGNLVGSYKKFTGNFDVGYCYDEIKLLSKHFDTPLLKGEIDPSPCLPEWAELKQLVRDYTMKNSKSEHISL